jgi:hypothetical protein
VRVETGGGDERFDAVVVTAFVSDAADLLTASGLAHTLADGQHVHCKAFTIMLNPAERALDPGPPTIYCHEGINLVLQPRHHRCVVLCTWSASTDDEFVLAKVREFLDLNYPIVEIRVRDNQAPDEAVYAADYVIPGRILRQPQPRIHFAGSYVKNSYPMDSGESAARSAFDTVAAMREAYALLPRQSTVGNRQR